MGSDVELSSHPTQPQLVECKYSLILRIVVLGFEIYGTMDDFGIGLCYLYASTSHLVMVAK